MMATEPCSRTGVETNLLITVLNVPVGGEMSYFRPWCERSRKEEKRKETIPQNNRRSRCPAQMNSASPSNRAGSDVCVRTSLCISGFACVNEHKEGRPRRGRRRRRRERMTKRRLRWRFEAMKCHLSCGLGRRGCNRLN